MEKVTIYRKGEFMGNIIKTEAHLQSFSFQKWAQYSDALFVFFKPKRKRRMYRHVSTPSMGSSDVLILKGWDNPNPDDLFGASKTSSNGVVIKEGRYRSFDKRWQEDFNSMIDQYIEDGSVEVVLDTRGSIAHRKAVKEFKSLQEV
jgi:hypothetical protein